MQSAGKQMAHTPQKKVQAKRWLIQHKKKCKQKDGSHNTKKGNTREVGYNPGLDCVPTVTARMKMG